MIFSSHSHTTVHPQKGIPLCISCMYVRYNNEKVLGVIRECAALVEKDIIRGRDIFHFHLVFVVIIPSDDFLRLVLKERQRSIRISCNDVLILDPGCFSGTGHD